MIEGDVHLEYKASLLNPKVKIEHLEKPNTNNPVSNTQFLKLLTTIIVSWILVQLWTNFVQVFFYNYMMLSSSGAYDTFLVASAMTVFFILLVYLADESTSEIVKDGLRTMKASEVSHIGMTMTRNELPNYENIGA
jgi:Na+/melibiose symporter-like transporter